jgi:hypothetical protein
MIKNASVGVPWDQLPYLGASEEAQLQELYAIVWRSTSIVDSYCNGVLRSTIDNETLTGPGTARFGFQQGSGLGFLYMRRWPVTAVLGIQMSWNRSFPREWSTIPAGQYDINHPLINMYADTASATAPDGGSSILVNPCALYPAAVGGSIYAPARARQPVRNSLRLIVSYTNGWPHTSLTTAADAGASAIEVDDVTGWTGAAGFMYDGASTEPISVTAVSAISPVELPNGIGTAQAGPGTLTLASPLAFSHDVGVLTTALPANVLDAAILASAAQVIGQGIQAIAVQTLSGSTSLGGKGVADIEGMYKKLLDPYVRVI